MKSIIKKIFIIMGLALGLMMSGILFYIWMSAYLNEGSALVTVNSIGEAKAELIFIPFMLLLIVTAIIVAILDLRKHYLKPR